MALFCGLRGREKSRSGNIVISGWLTKSSLRNTAISELFYKAGLIKNNWKHQWFVLQEKMGLPLEYTLTYYSDDTERDFKGSIDLRYCIRFHAKIEHKYPNFNNLFAIVIRRPGPLSTKKSYLLNTDTKEMMSRWTKTLCYVCDIVNVREVALQPSPEDSPQLKERIHITVSSQSSAGSFNARSEFLATNCSPCKSLKRSSLTDEGYGNIWEQETGICPIFTDNGASHVLLQKELKDEDVKGINEDELDESTAFVNSHSGTSLLHSRPKIAESMPGFLVVDTEVAPSPIPPPVNRHLKPGCLVSPNSSGDHINSRLPSNSGTIYSDESFEYETPSKNDISGNVEINQPVKYSELGFQPGMFSQGELGHDSSRPSVIHSSPTLDLHTDSEPAVRYNDIDIIKTEALQQLREQIVERQ